MSEKIKILTWLWSQEGGRTTYTSDHVNIWAAMVRRHLSIPHELAVVTDMPSGINSDIEIISPPEDFIGIETPTWNKEKPNCFRRLSLYSPNAKEMFGADRFVSMDLDVVIAKNIDSIINRPNDDIILYKGTSFNRPYNGSMVMMTAGARPQVYNDFSKENAILSGQKFVGSDQAWISFCLGPDEKTWDYNDGVYWYGSQYNSSQKECKMVFFPGNPKPWDLCKLKLDNFVNLWYKGENNGKLLILGYAKNVWEDLEKNISKGPFEKVILSPEAKEYWPHDNVLDIVESDDQAYNVAYMHGYKKENIIFCGRSHK